jgi:hypothetical protein
MPRLEIAKVEDIEPSECTIDQIETKANVFFLISKDQDN